MKLSVGEMVVRSRAGPFSHTYTHMAHLYSVHRELDVLDRQAVPVQMALGWHSEVCVSVSVCVCASSVQIWLPKGVNLRLLSENDTERTHLLQLIVLSKWPQHKSTLFNQCGPNPCVYKGVDQ